MKRIPAILLLFAVFAFTFCSSQNSAPVYPVDKTEVQLVSGGEVKCAVVCPPKASMQTKKCATEIAAVLKELSGKTVNTIEASAGEEPVEILVGPNAYEKDKSIYEEITYGKYLLRLVDNKVLVAAYDEPAYNEATKQLVGVLRKRWQDGTLALKNNHLSDARIPGVTGYIPPYNCTDMPSYYLQCGYSKVEDSAMQVAYEGRTDADFDAYCLRLDASGYNKVSENAFGKCRYASYSNGKYLVNVSLYNSTGLMNIVSEKEYPKSLWSIAGTKGTEKVLMMQVYQDNVVYKKSHPGGYIFRLSDGRYFIYDTGDDVIPNQMMEYMRSRNTIKDGKVHIALIIISHPHSDHMDGLATFASKFAKEIECEAVAFNMTNHKRQTLYSESTLHGRQNSILNSAATLGAQAYCLRAGQKFDLAGATLEVLFTPDELGTLILTGKNDKGEDDTSTDQNNSSNMVRLTVEGQRITLTGDCRGGEAEIFNSLVKPSFESEIMTAAHHGFNVAATLEMYTQAKPSVIFWPVRTDEQDTSRYFDKQLMKATYVKKHFFEDALVEIELPYRP